MSLETSETCWICFFFQNFDQKPSEMSLMSLETSQMSLETSETSLETSETCFMYFFKILTKNSPRCL